MKSSIVAACALFASTLACAQSTVSLSGSIDLYIAHATSGPTSVTRMEDGGNQASRLVFRGVEDLGGGMDAHYLLEAGFAPDTGAGTLPGPAFSFTRQSFVGLSGAWGSVDMGRMYTPMFYGLLRGDAFGVNAVFSPINLVASIDGQPGATVFAARASNMIRYRTPARSEWVVDIAYAPGESAADSRRSGDVYGGLIGWSHKPFYIGYSFQRTLSGSAAAPVASPTAMTYQSVNGSYEIGDLTLYANAVTTSSNAPGVPRSRLFELSARYPVTPSSNLIAGVIQRKVAGSDRRQFAWTLGYDYLLSKRTALYARWLHLSNGGGASATLAGVQVAAGSGDSVRVIAAGIRHNF
jgi:predicted porin